MTTSRAQIAPSDAPPQPGTSRSLREMSADDEEDINSLVATINAARAAAALRRYRNGYRNDSLATQAEVTETRSTAMDWLGKREDEDSMPRRD